MKKTAMKVGMLAGISLMAIFTMNPAYSSCCITPISYSSMVSELRSNPNVYGYNIDANTIAALSSCSQYWNDNSSLGSEVFTSGDYQGYVSGNQALWNTGQQLVHVYGQETAAWETCMLSKLATNSNETTRTQTTQIIRMVTDRIVSIMRPASFVQRSLKTTGLMSTGASAGDSAQSNSVWANLSYTTVDDTSSGYNDKKETEIDMGMIGFDRMFGANMVGGLSMGYDETTLRLPSDKRQSNTFSLTPYFSHMYNDNIGAYVLLSHAWINSDDHNKQPDYRRAMASAGFNMYQSAGKVLFNERIGYMTSRTKEDENKTKTYFNQIAFAGEASLPMNVSKYVVEPYLGAGYEIDTRYTKNSALPYDPNGFTGNLGTRVGISERLNSDIQLSSTLGRKDIDQYTVMGNIRYNF